MIWGLALRSLFGVAVGAYGADKLTDGKSTEKTLDAGKGLARDALNGAANFDPSKIDKEDMAEWGGAMAGAMMAFNLSGNLTNNFFARMFLCVIGGILGWMGGSALVSPSNDKGQPAANQGAPAPTPK